jgi:hypothetical protein
LRIRQLICAAFIVPALYEQYQNATPNAIDEFTLSQACVSVSTSLTKTQADIAAWERTLRL